MNCRACNKNQPRVRGLCESCHKRHSSAGTLERVAAPRRRTVSDILDTYAELRAQRMLQKEIAAAIGLSQAYLERVLARAARQGDPRSDVKLRKPPKFLSRKPQTVDVDPRWRERAACKDAEPGDFFKREDESKGQWIAASRKTIRTYCVACPVRLDCLQTALTNGEEGVWGGTTEQARRRMGPAAPRYSNASRRAS